MRKISAMYQWSGGTDYGHVCKECQNCIKSRYHGKERYKCLAYGNTHSEATDWKASYIACKAFDQEPPERPVIEMGIGRKREETEIEGQMSFDDFPEVLPE